MTEQWRDIPDYEGVYQVSDLGRVRRLSEFIPCSRAISGQRRWSGRILSPGLSGCYMTVTLCCEGTRRTCFIHQLVLLAFIGPRPEGLEACHGSQGPLNNQLINLVYGSRSKNQIDRRRDGTGCNVPVRRSDDKVYQSVSDAAKDIGIRHSDISHVLAGRQRTAGGFTWEKI